MFAGKAALGLFVVVPTVLLPWPGKVVLDHVVLSQPLVAADYPFFFQPFIGWIDGASPLGVLLSIGALLLCMLAVFGGWAPGFDTADRTGAGLAQGTDMASRSENVANDASSLMGGVVGWLEYWVTLRISHRLNHHYRSQLFGHIQHLPMTRLTDARVGDAMYRLMYDTPQLTEICSRIILTPILTPTVVGVSLWVLFQTYGDAPGVLTTAALVVPAGFLLTLPFVGPVRRTALAARRTGSETTVTIEEGMSNVLAVQSLGAERREGRRFDADSWQSYGRFRSHLMLWIGAFLLLVVAISGITLSLFYALTDRVIEGSMSVGDIGVIATFFFLFVGHAINLGQSWLYLQDNVAGLDRVFELMDEPPDHQPETPVPLPTVREGFRFEGVEYTYPDGTRALAGIDLEARVGSMVAIVGPAGAGKTTLGQMVPRFLRPSAGRILVDGVDLDRIDRAELRSQIAFVFQEPTLFDATIAENLRFGRRGATDAQLARAAEAAGAAEFIARLPLGMETPLGRGGGRLSVGQKQRLSIARALLRDAPVLVLDEPTAALDPETEACLVETLAEASRDRLVLVIAHRLSTIRGADQIVFLEDGRIRERGRHEELMALEDGRYRSFVELQSTPLSPSG
jgi:ABC-type multidrug transport system fused ATPase/permease subunit